jgi:phosphate/sulfate permease
VRWLHVLNAAAVLWLLAFSLYVYPELPARIPTHFGADGTADAWRDRTLLTWLLLPLLGIATAALLYGIGALLPSRPHLLNIPDRKKLLELPPVLQRPVLLEAAGLLYATTLMTLAMFVAIQHGAYDAAMNAGRSASVLSGVVIGLIGMPAVLVVYLVRIQRALNAAWRSHHLESSATRTS